MSAGATMGQDPPLCKNDPRLLLVSSRPSLLQSTYTQEEFGCSLWAYTMQAFEGEQECVVVLCCCRTSWSFLLKNSINWPHPPLSRSSHIGPCSSGRKEGQGAGGEKAASESALGEEHFIFCCCLFAFAFDFACSLLGPVVFLILFNLEFSNYAYLVHPHSAAVV